MMLQSRNMWLRMLALVPLGLTSASSAPPLRDTTVVLSKNYPGASISYKQTSICETTPGVKAYSGYVNLPSVLLANVPALYNASLFFWYFESRKDPTNAPLAIHIGGGPGSSGMDDSSGFPCTINRDSNSTTLNPWSWNNEVNMLYIDQPVSTGYSYSAIVGGMMDYLSPTYGFTPLEDPSAFVQRNLTTVPARISAPDPAFTVNTTMQAARTMWYFAQVWFQEFPEHRTSKKEVSLWTVSYGGYFAPAIFAHFQRQNERIANSTLSDVKAKAISLGTVGIQNGCVDALADAPFYPEFAYNNTFGIEVLSREIYEEAKANFTKPGGCADLIKACRAAGDAGDPLETGTNSTVNEICAVATGYCFGVVQGAFTSYSLLNPFDITQTLPTHLPIDYNTHFFNQPTTQSDLLPNLSSSSQPQFPFPINFTISSTPIISQFFTQTGDPMRRTHSDLLYLLQTGAKISLVYGDRDYRCNWLAGENISLLLASQTPSHSSFMTAGYEAIKTNATYEGGLVRQAGNLSFSRIYQAGHHVAAYQPETVYRVFTRGVLNGGRDVASGSVVVGEGYTSQGRASAFEVKSVVPQGGEEGGEGVVCLVTSPLQTCAGNQIEALVAGNATVEGAVVVEPKPIFKEVGDGSGSESGGGGGETPGGGEEENAAGRVASGGAVKVFWLFVCGFVLLML